MKTVAEVIGVSRSNLAERLQARPQRRIGRPPLPENELVEQIKALIGELPTYGYRCGKKAFLPHCSLQTSAHFP